jgi:arylsulfatase A-like enzyme/predicted negative regulator of RcsB-dependent stress response
LGFVFILSAVLVVGLVWLLLCSEVFSKGIDNVVLISVDTCRADYLGCYGHAGRTTPNIDQIAGQGVIFKNVVTAAPMTLPAHCSMLTGKIPPYHGVHDNLDYRLAESEVTLAEILKEDGFVTGGIISASVLGSQFGIGQGFDTFNDRFEKAGMDSLMVERRGGQSTRLALDWLGRHKDERFFLFLHYFDPHFDYVPPEPFASEFADNPYAGEIAYTDYCIAQVIQKLKELGLFDSSLIIITGDHGEMLGEHGELTHGYFIYESAIKVPLIFKLPGQNKPKEIKEVVGLVDIVPTVCGLLDIGPPPQVQGKDLRPYLFGKSVVSGERHVYTESLIPTKYSANTLLGVVTDKLKYIQTTRPELYDLAKDRQESENLINQSPQRARILQDRLRKILEESVPTSGSSSKTLLDEEARKRLESLGYVSGNVAEEFRFDESKNDPKDLVDLHVSVEKVHHLIAQKRLTEARELCHEMVSQHPDYYGFYRHLGRICFEEGDKRKAQVYMRQSLKLNPEQSGLHFNLAMLLAEQGRYDDAVEHFKEVLRLNPRQILAYNKLGSVLYAMGRFGEAIRNWQFSLKLNPNQPGIKKSISVALAQKQKRSDYSGEVHD